MKQTKPENHEAGCKTPGISGSGRAEATAINPAAGTPVRGHAVSRSAPEAPATGSSAQTNPAPYQQSSPATARWRVRRAAAKDADAVHTLVQKGMRAYAEASGLSAELAHMQLGALHESPDVVLSDIEKGDVWVGTSSGQIVASLRLKRLPVALTENILAAADFYGAGLELALGQTPRLAVGPLPSYKPEDYRLLSRFAVHPDFRGSGLGAAMLRSALRGAAVEGCLGLFLYTAAENSPLLHFYRSQGFSVQSVSGERGYARALLFARTPALDA